MSYSQLSQHILAQLLKQKQLQAATTQPVNGAGFNVSNIDLSFNISASFVFGYVLFSA